MAKPTPDAIASVLVQGDLSKLTTEQRALHLFRVCESLGMNPWTRPFDYIVFQGKMMMYARKDAAEQLRRIHGISVVELAKQREEDLLIVTAKVRTRDGRTDEDVGVVSLAGKRGDDLANKIMAAHTKAKRRATLSVCGLGILDESELESMPGAQRVDTPLRPHDASPVVVEPPSGPRPTPRAAPAWEPGRDAEALRAELLALRERLPEATQKWIDGQLAKHRGDAGALAGVLEALERKVEERKAADALAADAAKAVDALVREAAAIPTLEACDEAEAAVKTMPYAEAEKARLRAAISVRRGVLTVEVNEERHRTYNERLQVTRTALLHASYDVPTDKLAAMSQAARRNIDAWLAKGGPAPRGLAPYAAAPPVEGEDAEAVALREDLRKQLEGADAGATVDRLVGVVRERGEAGALAKDDVRTLLDVAQATRARLSHERHHGAGREDAE